MRWLVGVGLAEAEPGPLEVAAWLQRTADATVRALTVVPAVPLPGLPRPTEDQLRAEFAAVQQRRIDAVEGGIELEAAEVVVGPSVDRALVTAVADTECGLIIGRAAGRKDVGLPRLGRIARRVLRHLAAPTFIVPADLRQGDIGPGPIVLSLIPRPDVMGPLRLARDLSRHSKRPLVLVHAVEDSTTHEDLERFVRDQGLGDARLVSERGAVADVVAEAARREKAAIVVCGSRRLGRVASLFDGSTGSKIASVFDGPVAVVPP